MEIDNSPTKFSLFNLTNIETTTLAPNLIVPKISSDDISNLNDIVDVDDDPTNGQNTKILALLLLGLGSLIAGILPRLISQTERREHFFISLMLCFGGGVLLATALVHILADVRRDMPQNAEVYLCIGFFVIYFIDEFIHLFFGEALQHQHSNGTTTNVDIRYEPIHDLNNHTQHYGAAQHLTELETELLLNGNNHSHHPAGDLCDADEGNARICYTSHEEPCAETKTGALGLVTALSIHSVIEGLAIGLQSTSAGVMVLLLAVACHKYVMSFCLGLEIRMTANSTLKKHLIAVTIFSLGSSIGIAIGMVLDGIPSEWNKVAFPILQALAGGTLLYVAVCEVLPRERSRWHQNTEKRYAGLAQFLAVGIGFTAMTIVEHFLEH